MPPRARPTFGLRRRVDVNFVCAGPPTTVYAQRDRGADTDRSGRTLLFRLSQEGRDQAHIGIPYGSGVHRLTFVWSDDESTAQYHLLDTDIGDSDTPREVTATAAHPIVTVVDTVAGTTTLGADPPSGGSCVEETDRATGSPQTIDSLLDLTTPTVAEGAQRCHQMLENLPVARAMVWEKKMSDILAQQARGRAKLARVASKQAMNKVGPTSSTLYRLQLFQEHTGVLATPASARDVQAVYEKPSYESKQLGVEQRTVIEVEEEKEGWLRYTPRPGDKQQCWVAQSSANGCWELAFKQSSASLQLEFFVESSLELLLYALAKDADISEMLLNCCRRFAHRLTPLSLFESAGDIIEKSVDALINWLTDQVVPTSVSAEIPRSSPASATDIVSILLKLTVARGSLSAIIKLAEFLSSRPSLVTPHLVGEIGKLSDIQAFEPAAQQMFDPIPGSLQHFAAEWKEHVVPKLRESGKGAAQIAEIIAKVSDGEGQAAEQHIREALGEKTFSVIRIPNQRRLKESKKAIQYVTALQQQQKHARQCADIGTSPSCAEIMALIFSQVDLAALRIKSSARTRAPTCIDASAVDSLIQLLVSHCSGDAVIGDSTDSATRRDLCLSLLRLLSLNISRLVASKSEVLSDTSAGTLQQQLTSLLALDLTAQPECAVIANLAADLFGITQQFLLSSAGSKMDALKDIAPRLLSSIDMPLVAILEPEPKEVGKLTALSFSIPAGWEGCIDVEPGLIKIPTEHSTEESGRLLCHDVMSGDSKCYLEVRLADSSTCVASEANPQGFAATLGITSADGRSVIQFDPVRGKVTCDGTEIEMFEGEWWKNEKSLCAGDTTGLFLDSNAGELIALKNGKPICTIRSDLRQDMKWSWVVATTTQCAGMQLEVFGADVSSLGLVETLLRDEPHSSLSNTAVLERLGAAVVNEIGKVCVLSDILQLPSSGEALRCLVDLLKHKTLSSDPTSDLSQLHTEQTHRSWTWGKKHSTFRVDSAGTQAVRTNGTSPDYAGIFGSEGFSDGTHEWDLQFGQKLERFWIGVASENFPLGSEDVPHSVDSSQGHLWFFRNNGEYGQTYGSRSRVRQGSFRIREGTFRFRLDCTAGTFGLYRRKQDAASDDFELLASVDGIAEKVFPIVYFDYQTKVTLLETRSEDEADEDVVPTTLTPRLLTTTLVHAMQLLSDKSNPVSVSCAVALLNRIFSFVQEIFETIREGSPHSPFKVLQRCEMKGLLTAAVALAHTIARMRTAEGANAASTIVGQIVEMLRQIQETVDTCRDTLIDPTKPMRVAIRAFAAQHSCDMQTAAFYVSAFGDQASIEYETQNGKAAPHGYQIPVDKHWLIDAVDTISACGGVCIASLCSGLKSSEEDFDVSLFAADGNTGDTDGILTHLDVSSIRQPWFGFPSPLLTQLEEISIKAMVAHCGLLEASDSVETQGVLLHIGKEAIKIKRTCQDIYRKASASECPVSWEDATQDFLARAKLILQHASTSISAPLMINLRHDEDVFEWEMENAGSHSLCERADKVRRFIQSSVSCSKVSETLESRRTCIDEAEAGYRSALELLTAGEVHRQGLSRSFTVPAESKPRAGHTDLSGTWKCVIEYTNRSGTTKKTEREYELACIDQYIFGSKVSEGKIVEVSGRVLETGSDMKAEWTEVVTKDGTKSISKRFRVTFNVSEKTLTGSGSATDDTEVRTMTGELQRSGMAIAKIRVAGAGGTSDSHPFLLGISLTQRRCGLLQSASQYLAKLGPLSENRVRASSNELSQTVLRLMCDDPSELVKEAAGRLLLTRLDEGGARFLAAADKIDQVVKDAAYQLDETSAYTDVRSTFVAMLLSKVGCLPREDAHVVQKFIETVLETMRADSVDQLHTLRCFESLHDASHSSVVIDELQKQPNQELLWRMVMRTTEEGKRGSSASTQRASSTRVDAQPTQTVPNISDVIRAVRSKLGDVCHTWPNAGWEDSDEYESHVRRDLERGPTESNPCIVAKHLSESKAEELLSALQTTSLEATNNLRCARREDRVVLFLKGTEKSKVSADGLTDQVACIRSVSLQLLNLSLRPSTENLTNMLRLVETASPEAPFVSTTGANAEMSLELRVNAAMVMRNLISTQHEWADLFCESFKQAAISTGDCIAQIFSAMSIVPVFGHLLVLGVPEVLGCGQPTGNASNLDHVFERCTAPLRRLLRQVVSTPITSDIIRKPSTSFLILRARLMKTVFEAARISVGVIDGENISAVARLALGLVEAPASATIESLMTKLHSLYPLCEDGTPGKLVPATMCTSELAPELDSKPVDGTTGLELAIDSIPAEQVLFPDQIALVSSPDEDLLRRDEHSRTGENAVGYTSYGSVVHAISSAEHDLAIMYARLSMFATDSGQTSCATLDLQRVVDAARTLFAGGSHINPIIQTQACLTVDLVGQLVSRCAGDSDAQFRLQLLALGLLHKPIEDAKPAVSGESLEQLKHGFREFCRAADLMQFYPQLTKVLSSVDSSKMYDPFVVGELCQVELLDGPEKGAWVFSRITSESDRANMLNVFIFPHGSVSASFSCVHTKRLRKCSLPTVQGLRDLGADTLARVLGNASKDRYQSGAKVLIFSKSADEWVNGTIKKVRSDAVVVEYQKSGVSATFTKTVEIGSEHIKLIDSQRQSSTAEEADAILKQIASVPAEWEAPPPTTMLFSRTKKSRRGDLRQERTQFVLPRMQSGCVASEHQIRDTGVLRWSLQLADLDSRVGIIIGVAETRKFQSDYNDPPRPAKYAVTNSHELAAMCDAQRIREPFVANTTLQVELDMDSCPAKVAIYMKGKTKDDGRKLLLEKEGVDTEHHKVLFFGCVNEGMSNVRVNVLPETLQSHNMEFNEPEQRSERVLRTLPVRGDAEFHLWLADLCIRFDTGSSQKGHEWTRSLATRLFSIWAHGEPKTKRAVIAVLARISGACLHDVVSRNQKLQSLIGESIGRQWKVAAREQSIKLMTPAYLQALLEIAHKAGLLELLDTDEDDNLSLALEAMMSVVEPTIAKPLLKTGSQRFESAGTRDEGETSQNDELLPERDLEHSQPASRAAVETAASGLSRLGAVRGRLARLTHRPEEGVPPECTAMPETVSREEADAEADASPEPEPEPEPEEPEPEPELEPDLEPELDPDPDPEPEPESEPEPEPEREPDLQDDVAESEQAPVEPDRAIVAQLRELGFPRNACDRAAIATNNAGMAEAVEWCFEHSQDSDFNDDVATATRNTSSPSPRVDRTLSRTEIQLLAADIVRWEWRDGDSWKAFSADHSRTLEDGREGGVPTVTIDEWRVDLSTMQQHDASGTEATRQVRRCLALPFAEEGPLGLVVVAYDENGRQLAQSESRNNVLLVETIDADSQAERVSSAAGIILQGMILTAVGDVAVHSHSECQRLSASRPVTLVFAPAGPATQGVDCPGEHGLTSQLCSSPGFSCDVCRGSILVGSEMRSCRRCNFDVCLSCIKASAERARGITDAGVEFRSHIRSYCVCHKLLAPGLPIPPRAWWDKRRPAWTSIPSVSDLLELKDEDLLARAKAAGVDEDKMTGDLLSSVENPKNYLAHLIIESATAKLDFDAAFAESWSIEMDEALVVFVQERAVVTKKSATALSCDDLFDDPVAEGSNGTATEPDNVDGESTPDKTALHRNVSLAPRFVRSPHTPSPRKPREATHLADNSNAAICARFLLLREWNDAVRLALPLIDLRLFEVESHISHHLCIGKGRLLPATKNALIEEALKLSSSNESLPRVHLNIPAPDSEVASCDSVFEQLFKQLHDKHLTNTNKEHGEGQLWKVDMRGEGAVAFTDATDVGGHFRTSLRLLSSDLQSATTATQALFIPTPNFARGVGGGAEAAESYLPNPERTSDADLERYRFIGKLCGAAARFTAFFELELPSLCWKQILGQAVDAHELRLVDISTATYLESVLAIADETAWLQQESPVRWCIRLANHRQGLALRGDGSEIVAFVDREQYVATAEQAYLNQFAPQLKAMAEGFASVFPQLAARLLTWRELERRVCGLPDVDVSQLQKIAEYSGSYDKQDDYMQTFWSVLRELSGQERKQLLGFVWGRSRLPANCETPFIIDSSSSGDGDDQLPTSHTCMFQLHLPRYSSATVLKDRLLTAIQNASQRTDGNTTGTAGHYALSDDMEMLQPQKLNPTCLFDLQLHDGGHCETLLDFCNRAQVDVREIERCIGVTDMGSLLELEDDAVKQALTDTLPGAKKVPAEAQQARARYQAMTLPQLKRTCADSWLEDGGSISEMVDRLVANDIEVYGWEVPPSDERAPLQKPDVARVMVALAQARCRWPADVANPNSAPTRRPKEPEPTLSSADEASSDGDEELDELDEMLTLLAQHHEDESHLRP